MQVQSFRTLFTLSGPPLWQVTRTGAPALEQVARSWQRSSDRVGGWYRTYSNRVALQGLILLALTVLFFRTHRSLSGGTEAADEVGTFLFSRPASTALLIALILGIWIYPERPQAVLAVIIIVALAPLLQLLSGLLQGRMLTAVRLLFGLVLLQQIASLIGNEFLVGRYMLLLESVGGLTVVIWFRRGYRNLAGEAEGAGAWHALSRLLPIAALSFAVAVVANLVGAVRLAAFLSNGVLLSLWTASAYFLAGTAVAALLRFLARGGLGSFFRSVARRRRAIEDGAGRLAHFAAMVLWLRSLLAAFDFYDPAVGWAVQIFTAPVSVGELEISASRVGSLVGIFILSLVLARVVGVVLDEEIFSRLRLPRGIPGAVSMMSRYFIVGLGFVAGLSAAGIDLSNFGLAAGALGVGIGFGLQGVIANFVSGLILAVERPIQAGDTIEVGPLLGRVTDIGVRASKVRTFEGAEVIVPNSNLLSNDLINWTLSDERRRLELPVRVAYGTDPHRVIRILEGVAAQHPEILDDPPPRALFDGFGDNSLDFRLHGWVPFGKGVVTSSEVALGMHDALKKAGIEIPVPRRDVELRSPQAGEALAPEQRD